MNTNTTPTGEAGAAVRADSEITEAPRAVQTSCGWDAAPVDPDPRTIRVISSWVQAPRFWRADVARFSRGYRDGSRPDLHGGDAVRIRQAAATAALWDVPVGLITGVREELAP